MPPRKVASASAAPKPETKKQPRAPRPTVPIEEHPGYVEGGEPARTSNGPRPQDPKQTASQDPELDYAAFSDAAFGPLPTDEEV